MTATAFDDYLTGVSEEQRLVLERLRDQIRKAAPDARESISYQMPTFKYRGRPLLYFAANKNHCSLHPCTEAMMEACGDEIAWRRTGKGTIRFTPDDPLPASLVRKIVKARIKEIEGTA